MPRSVQEERVRRVARRHGLALKKAGRGKPRARDFGRYWLVDAARNTLVFPDEHGGSLDDLERYLNSDVDVANCRPLIACRTCPPGTTLPPLSRRALVTPRLHDFT